MKKFLLVLAIILITFSTVTFIDLWNDLILEEFYGALTGYIIILLLSFGLIYYSQLNKIKLDKEINSNRRLKILKEKGIITDSEYHSKLEKTNSTYNLGRLKKSSDYKNLEKLYKSGILTKQEFDSKVKTLMELNSKQYPSKISTNEEQFTLNDLFFGESKNAEILNQRKTIVIIISVILFIIYLYFI